MVAYVELNLFIIAFLLDLKKFLSAIAINIVV